MRGALLSGQLVAYPLRPWWDWLPDRGGVSRRPITSQPTLSTPPSPKPAEKVTATHFSVRWVDEIGEAIPGLEVAFAISGAHHKTITGADGVARYTDPNGSGFAWVEPADLDALCEIVKPRWDAVREGKVLTESNARVVPLHTAWEGVSLVAEEMETLSVQPYVERVRLLGGHFDPSKAFLVPEGVAGARAILRDRGRLNNSTLLLVGHTDTSASEAYNDKLSLERAGSLKDYLTQNVDGWLSYYRLSVSQEKRWGPKEDLLMIDALPDHGSRPADESSVR